MLGTAGEASPNIPQLQDVGDVPGGEDPSDVVEISHVEAAVGAAREGHGGQELVAVGEAVAAGTGNAPAAPIAHDAPDDGRLKFSPLVFLLPQKCKQTRHVTWSPPPWGMCTDLVLQSYEIFRSSAQPPSHPRLVTLANSIQVVSVSSVLNDFYFQCSKFFSLLFVI